MMHPNTEIRFIDEEIGYGVVATKLIPKGSITWVQDDLDKNYTPEEVEKMHPKSQEMVEKYTFRNNKGNYVMCWDLAKYVNHSFNSNCLSTAYDFEIAVRDIQVGEQLTDDYGYLNINEPFRPRDEGAERTTVYPDDLLRYHKVWDEKIEEAFRNYQHISQPLQDLVPSAILKEIVQRLEEGRKLESILKLYFENGKK